MREESIRKKYREITLSLINKGLTITTMESCTSGQIASLLTDTGGASAVVKGAFITYSNEAKIKHGVPRSTIDRCGVYSKETAAAMAEAAKKAYASDISVGVTGTFGNVDLENSDSVPGEIFFAIITADRVLTESFSLAPQSSRYMYKLAAADKIADALLTLLS